MTNKVKVLLIILLVFVFVATIQSNMGFKLNYPLKTNTGDNNFNWVSLPYFNNYATANDICKDINEEDCVPGTASQVLYFDTIKNSYVTYVCDGKNPFNINPGKGYGIFVTPGSLCTLTMVGSHDDSYDSVNGISFFTNSANNNLNWISIPYHTQTNNWSQLCMEINADCGMVAMMLRGFSVSDNAYISYSCGSAKNPPALGPGYSLALFVNPAPAPGCWHPSHY